jgi:ribosome-associated toxin RatA of RatAB toxin-antitoxin module
MALFARFTLAFALAAASLAGTAQAETAQDREIADLQKRGEARRYHVKTADSHIDTGGAAILVHAPIAAVRAIVTDYRHYAKFIKPFQQAKVLSKKDGATNVYLQVPIAHGAATVWVVARMRPSASEGGGERVTGELVQGNVDGFRATWRLVPVDADTTLLKLEIFVDPKLPIPASLVTPELEYAADQGVTGVRDRAEHRAAPAAARTSPAPVKSANPTPNVARR